MNVTIAIFNNIGTKPQADYMQFVIENDIAITWYEIAKMSLDRSNFEKRKREQHYLMLQIERALAN